ncbi:bifunctional lysylphosphatidylglycerol flippase/synthetase MprF [Mesorhizobium sp. WSM4976]|uniref:bifunctional lysylphosphatidylglycerol flippase/synthetase MprF n=1 Tax=Mesorhizobium sp. WSM4976 TaxID=3038549 RepID=UPI0024180B55|nr:bifunctional lysylphosphatidylglycerol flippase/synthetase MprF [Mesorhizobium sp. WSM4976]MDG4897702.1 bifunctional lysylphosphatidylglycerol flippase/synthetase MprF [Mesorhizobium sp. WSM4976]
MAVSITMFAALILSVFAFGSIAETIDYQAFVHVLKHLPPAAIGWSILATMVSFAALIGRDVTAVRYVGAQLPRLAPIVAGFCGTALGNAAGFGTLTGAAVRYRIYGAVGVQSQDIARLLLFIAAGYALGLTGFGGLAALLEAKSVAHLLGWPTALLSILSGAALVCVAALVLFGLRKPIHLGGFCLPAPPKELAAIQLGLSGIRLVSAAAALWVLLPGGSSNFFSFAAIFSAATALGAVSNLPGGIGVFEAVVFWAFGRAGAADQIAAALLAYRGIYYAMPLIVSAALLAVFEVRFAIGSQQSAAADERLVLAAARLAPRFIGVIAFATGIMLLVSGATPTFGHRLAILSMRLPLWVVETSHFLGSLLGIVFLFVARGLFERRDGAWWIAITIATASLCLSLTKGLAYGEAGFLAIVLTLLITTRRQFDRPASMLGQAFTLGWFATVGLIVIGATAIFLVAFRTADYTTHDLWWEFEFDAQAPRALRALLGAAVLATAIGFWQLLRPPKGLAPRPDADALGHAARIINEQDRSQAMMAMMGDKSLLFSDSGNAFIMYGKRGRSWIALFDPVGPVEDWHELITRFVTLAASHGGRAAFYQVRPETLRHYLDAGLSVMKLGEEACVQVASFELRGRAAAHLRYALKRGERDGLTFELLAPHQMAPVVDDLADISAAWLRSRRTEEKGFSIAAFEPGYLGSQMIALVRQHEVPVAFSTIMTTQSRKEASIGLMRHTPGASSYAMEFLFTQLIDHLKRMHYQTLSLGVAPLSGVLPAPLSSRWHWLGAVIWRYGTPFYNFRGLRAFKDKFNPVWEPRYLAASGTLGPFVTLADAAGLIGLNFKGSRRYWRGA